MGYVKYRKYMYDGPVMELDKCIVRRWIAYTFAPSASKAKNNLAYRYKKKHGKMPTAKIKLPGRIVIVDDTKFDDGEQLAFDFINEMTI